MDDVRLREASPADADEVLRLLLALHVAYVDETNWDGAIADELRLPQAKVDPAAGFVAYVAEVLAQQGVTRQTIVAEDVATARLVGVIMGSVTVNDALLLRRIGVVEDWFVESAHRGRGIGSALYARLEAWFRAEGCQQVMSDTWMWNAPSRRAHARLGFLESNVEFRKVL